MGASAPRATPGQPGAPAGRVQASEPRTCVSGRALCPGGGGQHLVDVTELAGDRVECQVPREW